MLETPNDAVLSAVPLLFAGLFVGVLLAPILALVVPLPRVVAVGATLQATGFGGACTASSLTTFLASTAAVGIGFGIVESSGVALARRLKPDQSERTLITLTAYVATAACAAPIVITAFAKTDTPRSALLLFAVPHLVAAVALAVGSSPSSRTAAPPASARARLARPQLLIAAALFCYVGAESVLAGWSAAYLRDQLDVKPATAAVGTSAFWALLTFGRIGGVIALKRSVDPATFLLASLTAVALLLAGATALTGQATALLGVALAVAACGPCYALLIELGVQHAPSRTATTVSGTLIAIGALGGAAIAAVVRLTDLPITAVPATAAGLAVVAVRQARTHVSADTVPAQ